MLRTCPKHFIFSTDWSILDGYNVVEKKLNQTGKDKQCINFGQPNPTSWPENNQENIDL